MKKAVRIAAVSILFALLLICLAGCEDSAPTNVVVVDGSARANNARFSFDIPALNELLNRAAHFGYVGQIIVDGVPRETASFTLSDLSAMHLTHEKEDEIARSNQAVITRTLQSAAAVTEEADVLKAVQLGARALQAVKREDSENWLILMDNLLPTTGVLDFTAGNLLDADPALIVELLQSRGELPALQDLHVVVFGCGDTVAPQEPLNTNARDKLKAIWKAIFLAGNAKSVEFREELPTDTEINELLPKVSTITVITDKIIPPDDTDAEEEPPAAIVRLDDATVSFLPDTAVFRDPEAAREAVGPFAGLLCENPEQKALIAGSTATAGTRSGCLTLSRERAAAVGELLIAEGVDPAQLIIIGVGQEPHSLRVPDTAADGRLIESAAMKNRCVFLTQLPSDVAEELLRIDAACSD